MDAGAQAMYDRARLIARWVDAGDFLYHNLDQEFARLQRAGTTAREYKIMGHGAGTQTSVLLALANHSQRPYRLPWGEMMTLGELGPAEAGYLPLDFVTFADVGDDGTPCEWPETMLYLAELSHWSYIPIVWVAPGDWNPQLRAADDHRGLYDHNLARGVIPSRMLRICTDRFKITPQLEFLAAVRTLGAEYGITVTFEQVIGFSANEAHRAARFRAGEDWIKPRFPLVEWGWNREHTLAMFERLRPQMVFSLGLPERSGCWFCPFQKRGHIVIETGKAVPRSWVALDQQHPELLVKAEELEAAQTSRRLAAGKEPIYLYGKRPVRHWVEHPPRRTGYRQLDLLSSEGDDPADDLCVSGVCMY